MKKKLIFMTGIISVALILAGCGAIAQEETAPQQGADVSESNQAAEANTTEVEAVAETSPAPTEAEDRAAAVTEARPQRDHLRNQALREALLPVPENELSEGEYHWSQLLPRDGIRPIYEDEVEFVAAKDAPYDDNELVIGVEINGEAKAYAIGPLNAREMVNDIVGGVPVLVTW